MLIHGQGTIVGTLTLEMRDDFGRSFKSISITSGQSIEVSDKLRFQASVTDAVDDGFITLTLESADEAVQEDLTGGGGDSDSVQAQSILATDFTITHNNKKIVEITTDGGDYTSSPSTAVAVGTTVGQRLLIVILPQIATIRIKNRAKTVLLEDWTINDSGSGLSPSAWLYLIWDGTNWNELERNDGISNRAPGANSHAEGWVNAAFGAQAHVEGQSNFATAAWTHAEGNSTTAGSRPQTFNASGTDITIEGDWTENAPLGEAQFFDGDQVFFFNMTGGTNNTLFSSVRQISDVAFDGTNTTFTIDTALDDRDNGDCVDIQVGNSSHAEGNGTIASGQNSHVEGEESVAIGEASHAEGGECTANGDNSHAEGSDTNTFGDSSHAEGRRGKTYGDYSHTEGYDGLAACRACHVEGESCKVGFQPDDFTVSGSDVTISGNATSHFGNGQDVYIFDLSGGTNNALNQLQANVISPPTYDGVNTTFSISTTLDDRTDGKILSLDVSSQAHAEGSNTNATGRVSHTEGSGTTAAGINSHAEGDSSFAFGSGDHAEGVDTNAYGGSSHSEGNSTTTFAQSSHSEGTSTIAGGSSSHAEGQNSIAAGSNSHVEGNTSTSAGDSSHAEGYNNQTGTGTQNFTISSQTITIAGDVTELFLSGDNLAFFNLYGGNNNTTFYYAASMTTDPVFDSVNTTFDISSPIDDRTGGTLTNNSRGHGAHAEGTGSKATQDAAHAEGQSSLAAAFGAHAEGQSTAYGPQSHSEGVAVSFGAQSHAEGNNVAIGQYAHAEGDPDVTRSTSGATGVSSHAEGKECLAGATPRQATISGTTVTISSIDVTSEFHDGDVVQFYNEGTFLKSGLKNTAQRTISGVAFSSDTTFTINSAVLFTSSNCYSLSQPGLGAHAEGNGTIANGNASHSQGRASIARQTGQHAMASGSFFSVGDAQSTEVVTRAATTNASPTEMYIDGALERVSIANNTTYGYNARVIARQTGGTSACAYFELTGFITRDAGASTTRLVPGAFHVTSDGSASTWTVVETGDAGSGSLLLTVTGETGKNINWVASVRLVETFG